MVQFPVLSDLNRKISRDYGVLAEEHGHALRGTFIIDPKQVVQYMSVNASSAGRSTDEPLRMVQALQTGELCPADWRPGQALL
jgi:alkyl hydroperoxide reductase subunit AhpC